VSGELNVLGLKEKSLQDIFSAFNRVDFNIFSRQKRKL